MKPPTAASEKMTARWVCLGGLGDVLEDRLEAGLRRDWVAGGKT